MEAGGYAEFSSPFLPRKITGTTWERWLDGVLEAGKLPGMEAKSITPILNVADIAATVAWFETCGWKKLWDWNTPPSFACVGSGKETCIFLCRNAQGGRGRGMNTTTFQQDGDEEADKGVWMSVWVDDVDATYKICVAAGLDVTLPPTDMPWKVREMHLRHPDGHVFRVGVGLEAAK
jgi:catechol 2,3-dioxygenase-like lactoylglutathione lyase family enzyme